MVVIKKTRKTVHIRNIIITFAADKTIFLQKDSEKCLTIGFISILREKGAFFIFDKFFVSFSSIYEQY